MQHPARQALEYAAAALGFSAVGIAPACEHQGDYLREWLAAGMHAEMHWMERHLPARLEPRLVLPGVRSIIILTYEYPREDSRQAAGTPRIARYAQGEDYHKLLAPKLADLDETLQLYGGTQRCFSDSGPVSERFFAARAGLGWIGRNGLLIRPGRGSYCFLSSILTTLELPADSPMAAHCGTCHRCEQACPTHALRHGCCDARHCLAYWTIESPTPPPPHITRHLENTLYGCDRCQEACPWNRPRPNAPAPRIDPHLLMPAQLARLSGEKLRTMQEEKLNTLIQGTPLRRTGAARLKSNLSRPD